MNFRNRHDATKCDMSAQGAPDSPLGSGSPAPSRGLTSAIGASGSQDKLESWKEIAGFIGRDDRTAMRWAKDQGMPVRRVPGGKRGRVYASRAEISAWLLGHAESEAPAPAGPVIQSSSGKRIYLLCATGIVAAVILILLGIAITRTVSHHPPVRVRFGESTVEALDSEGHQLWTHRFPRKFDLRGIAGSEGLNAFVRIADLRGDGGREVLLAAPYHLGDDPSDPLLVEIVCFSETGELLWSFVPKESFRFGYHDLTGQWCLEAILVSRFSAGVIWMAFSHAEWGDSWVVSVDARTGLGTLRYVNTGTLRVLNEIKSEEATYLLAGGFNNEYDGASLAAVDQRRPFAASPQTPGTRHQCVNCPAGVPDYYFVFPRSEVNKVHQLYEYPVGGIAVDQDPFVVSVFEFYPRSNIRTIYDLALAPTILPVSVRYSSTYVAEHLDLERTHKLGHALESCPERLHPQPVRMWTPTEGWTGVKMRKVD